jgi:hypothetical protein
MLSSHRSEEIAQSCGHSYEDMRMGHSSLWSYVLTKGMPTQQGSV